MAFRPPSQQDSPPHEGPGREPIGKFAALNLRAKSLTRGNVVVFLSMAIAFAMSDFPRNRPTLWLAFPLALSIYGTVETMRCLRPRWSFYHGAVLLCLYMDLMAMSLVAFMLLYPYANWISATH